MSKLQKVVARAEALIKTGTHVLATAREPGPGIVSDDYVDSALFHEWKLAALSFIEHVFGLDSCTSIKYRRAASMHTSTTFFVG